MAAPRPERILRRCSVGAILLVIGTMPGGCDRAPQTARAPGDLKSGIPIALLGPAGNDPEWQAVQGGAQRYAAEVPTVRITAAVPRAATLDSLRATLAELLARQPGAVCVYVTAADLARPAGLLEVIARVQREDHVLITIGRPFDDPRIYGQVVMDLPEGAEQLGAALPRSAPGRQTYLVLDWHGATPLDSTIYERFAATASKQFALTQLQERNAAQLGQPASKLVEQMLETFPHAALLVTLDPDVWLHAPPGWDQSLRRLNPDFRYATLSTSPLLWRQLGTPAAPGLAAALVGPLHGDLGHAAIAMAMQALVSQREPTPVHSVPCEVVTPADLPGFARRYTAAAGGMDVMPYLPPPTPIRPARRPSP